MRRDALVTARHALHTQREEDQSPLRVLSVDCRCWADRDLWNKSEAVCLLAGIEPIDESVITSDALGARYVGIKMLFEKNIGQTLIAFRTDPLRGPLFLPWAIVEWAESIPVPVSLELKSAVMEAKPSSFRTGVLLNHIRELTEEIRRLNAASVVPPYLRPDHVHFAPELAGAVAAWLALYQQMEFRNLWGHGKQVRAWLRARYAQPLDERFDFSGAAIERIVAISKSVSRSHRGKIMPRRAIGNASKKPDSARRHPKKTSAPPFNSDNEKD